MASLSVEFDPRAIDEAQASFEWYRQRNQSAASAFLSELDHAIELISTAPRRWPAYMLGTRRYLLRRFPYSIVYRELASSVQVVAVAHARRKPGYWRAR